MSDDNNVTPIWRRLEDLINKTEERGAIRSNPVSILDMVTSQTLIEETALRLSMKDGEVRLELAIAISRYIRVRIGLPPDPIS